MKRRIIQAALLFSYVFVNGQEALNNSGNLQIHPGASITSVGNFSNSSSAALTNNGVFYVKGNIVNYESSMPAGAGTLHLNGTGAQSIAGTQPFNTYDLITNNAAGITLNNNLSVSGVHNFTNGIIVTSATPNYLVYGVAASYSGDGDAKHVNGWVKKIGASDFIFPVGNGTVERTVAISNLSANSEFNAKHFTNTPFLTQMQIPVREVNQYEYWTINKVSGATASVTLNWDYNKIYFPNWIVPDILVAGYNGSLWVTNGGSATGNAATTGTITSVPVSTFNLFSIGSRSYILPLTLISFTAERQDDFTQLVWITSNEFNVNRFVTERSDDNVHFYAIGGSLARNSGNKEKYFVRDDGAINDVAYYRLRSIENDGKEKLSHTVLVRVTNTKDLLTLTSNPVNAHVVLFATSGLKGMFDYQLSTVNGQIMQQGKLNILNGGHHNLLLQPNINPGAYILTVKNTMEKFTFKLIKN